MKFDAEFDEVELRQRLSDIAHKSAEMIEDITNGMKYVLELAKNAETVEDKVKLLKFYTNFTLKNAEIHKELANLNSYMIRMSKSSTKKMKAEAEEADRHSAEILKNIRDQVNDLLGKLS